MSTAIQQQSDQEAFQSWEVPAQLKPDNIKAGEWLAIVGAATGGFIWVYKKAIQPLLQFIRQFCAMPASISVIKHKQEEIGRLVMMARSRSYAVMDSQPHPIWESDGDGRCIFANQNMLSVLGLPFEDISGDGWKSLVHQDDRSAVVNEWDKAITDRRDFQMEYRWVGAGGRIIGIRATARRILDGQNVIGYISNVKVLH